VTGDSPSNSQSNITIAISAAPPDKKPKYRNLRKMQSSEFRLVQRFPKYIKKYHPPKTPCQRLLESDHVCSETKDRLIATFLDTNPFALKKTIQAKLKIIFNTLK